MVKDKDNSEIFLSMQYYEAGSISAESKVILDKAGAKCHSYLSELVKVAITNTTDNEDEYAEIADIYDIPVVSCSWVILSHKCGKPLPTKAFPPKLTSTALFKSKAFSASDDIGTVDRDSLWAMLTFNGAVTQKALTQRVTHLLCTSTTSAQYLAALKFTDIKIVSPDWVTDCLKLKKLVDETEYHPKLLITNLLPPRAQLQPPAAGKQTSPATDSPRRRQKPTTPTSSRSVTTTSPQTPLPMRPNSGQGQSPAYAHSTPQRGVPPAPHPILQDLPPGFTGFTSYHQEPNVAAFQHAQAMAGSASQQMLRPGHRPMLPQFADHLFQPQPGLYGMPAGPDQLALQATVPQHSAMSLHRPYLKASSPSQPDHMGHAPIHYTGASRQSPISPSMMSMRHPNPMVPPTSMGMQRASPINRKTPPMMNLGQMTEVPYPSQASLPEETPIIRMTNMAAFPMGNEVGRKSPATSGKTTPKTPQLNFTTPGAGGNPNRSHSRSPVNNRTVSKSPVSSRTASRSPVTSQAPANVSVIKSVKSSTSVADVMSAAGQSSTLPSGGGWKGGQPPTVPGSSTAISVDTAGGAPSVPAVYYGYDSTETPPADMCLIGCIFYMGEYLKADPCEQWIKAIEENGGTVDPSYSNRVTHVLVDTQASDVCRLALNDEKRVVTAHWLNDVIGSNRMEPPWRAHHLPHPHVTDKPLCANQVVGITGFDREERRVLYILVRMIGAMFTNYLAKTNTILICKKLEGEKVTMAKEWGVECVNVSWLSELVLGNLRALKLPIDSKYKVFDRADDFLIDRGMAAAVMTGWQTPLKIPKDNCRKFKPSSKSADSAWENKRKADGEMFVNPNKRMRLQEIQNTKSNLPEGQKPCVLLTGFPAPEKRKHSEMVLLLGGLLCEDPSQCTHIIAEKVVRTPNFLMAINYCSYISSSEWITESAKSGHFVDERVFTLQNSEAGSMWNILEALDRRRVHGRPFNGLTFHITPGVPLATSLPRKFLCELLGAGGGSVQPRSEKRWSAKKISDTQKASHNNKPTYVVVACKDDIHICLDLLSSQQDIYSVEFILSGVMNQNAAYEAVLCTRES